MTLHIFPGFSRDVFLQWAELNRSPYAAYVRELHFGSTSNQVNTQMLYLYFENL